MRLRRTRTRRPKSADLEYSATDYFGNEGGDSAFYVSAALLIEVPPAAERAERARLVSRQG